jgi:hypothetical protein
MIASGSTTTTTKELTCEHYAMGLEEYFYAVIVSCTPRTYSPGSRINKDDQAYAIPFNRKCSEILEDVRFDCYDLDPADTDFESFLSLASSTLPCETLHYTFAYSFESSLEGFSSSSHSLFAYGNDTTGFDEGNAFLTMYAVVDEVTSAPTTSPSATSSSSLAPTTGDMDADRSGKRCTISLLVAANVIFGAMMGLIMSLL